MKHVALIVACAAMIYFVGSCALSWQRALDRATDAANRAADANVAQEWTLERDRQAADREWLISNPDPSPEGE